MATHLITLPGHVNACCVISEICIMCVTSNLHGERFGPKQETKQDGGQGKITLRSFHTKKKKKLKLSLLLEGSQCRAVSNNCFLLDQTIPRKEPVLLDMWNPWYVNVGPLFYMQQELMLSYLFAILHTFKNRYANSENRCEMKWTHTHGWKTPRPMHH